MRHLHNPKLKDISDFGMVSGIRWSIAQILLFIPNIVGQKIITDDIRNFWNAYDKIVLEKDTLKQVDLIKTINNHELDKISPKIVAIKPFKNGSKKVAAGVLHLSITFSQEMDTNSRSFDYGPLGEESLYTFRKIIGWSNNNKTFIYEVGVEPKRHYQFVIGSGFRDTKGISLKPYLVEFKTK